MHGLRKLNFAIAFGVVALASGAAAAGTLAPPIVAANHPSAAGQAGASGVVGLAALLGLYDLLRRTTCSGDFLNLGGPGFTTPIRPTDNVLRPVACATRRP